MSCSGKCCAVFNWQTPPDDLRARWEGYAEPTSEPNIGFKRDDFFIADMLVGLTPEQAQERGEVRVHEVI